MNTAPISCAKHLAIIADDLSGACDTGIQFVRHGFSTTVSCRAEAGECGSTDILVLNTSSRDDLPQITYEKIDRSCRLLTASGRRLLYQKIDSMLRGHLATQIDAAMKATGHSLALVAPAFPVMGRQLVDGWLKTHDSIAKSVHLPTLLGEQGLEDILHVDQECVSHGQRAVLEQINQAYSSNVRVMVIDASGDDDLLVIAKAWKVAEPAPLLVGSGGLASQVAKVCCPNQQATKPVAALNPYSTKGTPGGSVILLIGSRNPKTLRQIDTLLASNKPVEIRLNQSGVDKMASAIQESQDVLVRVDLGAKGNRDALGKWAQVFERCPPAGLLLSGGDTAELVCDAFGVEAIELQNEILPGVPWGWLKGGSVDGLAVGTKSGGFGDDSVLARAVNFLHGQQNR